MYTVVSLIPPWLCRTHYCRSDSPGLCGTTLDATKPLFLENEIREFFLNMAHDLSTQQAGLTAAHSFNQNVVPDLFKCKAMG